MCLWGNNSKPAKNKIKNSCVFRVSAYASKGLLIPWMICSSSSPSFTSEMLISCLILFMFTFFSWFWVCTSLMLIYFLFMWLLYLQIHTKLFQFNTEIKTKQQQQQKKRQKSSNIASFCEGNWTLIQMCLQYRFIHACVSQPV